MTDGLYTTHLKRYAELTEMAWRVIADQDMDQADKVAELQRLDEKRAGQLGLMDLAVDLDLISDMAETREEGP